MPLDLIRQYGYLGLFLALLGIPFPGETLLSFSGYLIARGVMHLGPAFGAATAGNLIGITVSYGVGRFGLARALRRYGHLVGLTQRRRERARRWFGRWGKFALVVGFFIPGMRDVVGLTAGAARLRYGLFALIAYPGGALWVIIYLMIGYWVGDQWEHASSALRSRFVVAGEVIGGLLVLYVAYWLIRRRVERP